MAGRVPEIQQLLEPSIMANEITRLYSQWAQNRLGKEEQWLELRNYVFATDTTTTSNSTLPWKNKTTLPKLCQIRDNLHANYMAAIFPNDNWLDWIGYSEKDEEKGKRTAILAYMSNKIRQSGYRETVSQLLYDYIDYGNAFGEVRFVKEFADDETTGEEIPVYIGPKLFRISPYDIVFNPIAESFEKSPKIMRYIKSIGEIKMDMEEQPDLGYLEGVFEDMVQVRQTIGRYDIADINKASGISIDGFGNLQDYYGSNYVELLEFEGTLHDPNTGELLENKIITVVDRRKVLRIADNPSWLGKDNKLHVGWRTRPDNIYAMGPLDNLVGMQYRIDHLENIKADLFDLIAHPPIKITGNVEEFEWGPFAEIFCGDDGDVEILKVDSTALSADMQISTLEQKMEEFAGAPKQAMGIRTPGEKTAYEVQTLENAAGRIFQDKTLNFDINFTEPSLNLMLEAARRHMDGPDIVRTMDDDLGVVDFLSITKEDIMAKGKLRPMGARHFAAQAQLIQNLTSGLQVAAQVPGVLNHVSPKKLAHLLFEEISGLERYSLVSDNAALMEQADSQRLANQAQEDLAVEQQTPVEGS